VITVLIYKYAEARWLSYVFQFFLMLAQMNLSLAIFNLLPVPPLDGYRFLDHFIFKGNLSMNRQTMQIIQIVFLVVCISGLLNGLLSTVNSNVFNAVFRFVFRIL
jgi:Zn-dependent protease